MDIDWPIIYNAYFNCAFLKFNRVTSGKSRHINQFLGNINITIMVDAYFRDNVTWISISNFALTNGYAIHY